MSTISGNNSDDASESVDDMGLFADSHAADLRRDEPIRSERPSRAVDCIYARVHGLRSAYIQQRILAAGVAA